ncbi:MAG: hypothetical protein QGG64_16675 [Candidatus Latescibacteria bacterium]|jgi:uncharacterized protein YlxW (UPF0749 family)|nr:hypothetical protein [Candidatus Latescibacterota bacterium]
MTWIAWIAVFASLTCVLAKWIYARKKTMLERLNSIEKSAYMKARKDLAEAKQNYNELVQQQKQLESKLSSAQRNVGELRKQEKDLTGRELEAATAQARQKENLDLGHKR